MFGRLRYEEFFEVRLLHNSFARMWINKKLGDDNILD